MEPDLEGMSREELLALARAQAVEIGQLKAEVGELRERLARVERLVSRNSGNSGMPPASDDQPGKALPKDKPVRGSGRRPGKQPGAAGMTAGWSDDPDTRVDHFPVGACACGADLADAADLGVTASHQQVDIPLVTATRSQHDLHTVACGCGRVHTAARPEGVPAAPVSIGVNLRAWCVYLMVAHAIPVQRCVELVESLSGAQVSVGFVHGMLARAAVAVAAANMRIRALLVAAWAVCCDETPIRVGAGKAKKYLLVACTALYTCFLLGDRTLATFKKFVVTDLGGVLVHDRYQNYDSPELGKHAHQLCAQHLLRDLEDCAETYPDAHWPGQVQTAIRGLIHHANLAREQNLDQIDPQVKQELVRSYRHGVRVGLSEVRRVAGPAKTTKQPTGRVLLETLRDREADVLRFAHDLRVPPTSNQAERDLRPAKTQQKISGRLRSAKTTEHRYAIRGYLSTAAKHNADLLTAIRDALLGRPWMPPDPATT